MKNLYKKNKPRFSVSFKRNKASDIKEVYVFKKIYRPKKIKRKHFQHFQGMIHNDVLKLVKSYN